MDVLAATIHKLALQAGFLKVRKLPLVSGPADNSISATVQSLISPKKCIKQIEYYDWKSCELFVILKLII